MHSVPYCYHFLFNKYIQKQNSNLLSLINRVDQFKTNTVNGLLQNILSMEYTISFCFN